MNTLANANANVNAYVRAPPRPAALRMFCFHHAGGGASLFRGWQRAIGPHVAVCPVLLPGREARAAEPRFTELDALIADLDAELGDLLIEPHVFFGHSMGALIAYRLACHRRGRGENLPRALLLSSYPAPHLAAPMPAVDDRDDDALIGLLTGTGGLAPALLDWPGGVSELLAVTRDDLRLCAGHRDLGEAPLPCPIHVFGSDADALVGERDLREWDRHAASPVELRVLSGDHFYLRDDPAPLLGHVRALLRRYLQVGVILADAKECAVWWAEAGSADPALAALLPAAERERAGRLRRVVDRDRTIVAWALARTLLGELLGEDPADVAIERRCVRCGSREHGKPRLADRSAGIHFSLAHSGPHVVVAVSRAGPVGIDVEWLKPQADHRPLYRKTLTADEAVAFHAGGARPHDFLRTWVRKEAVTKAVGTGIATPFHSFAVGERANAATLLTWPDDPSLVDRTTLLDLPGDPDRPAAVAVLARDVHVSEHDGARVLLAAAGAGEAGTGMP